MSYKYVQNKFANCFLSLDAMGQQITLNFDGHDTYRTGIGTVFTFGCLVICILVAADSLGSFFHKSNPNVLTSSYYDDQPLQMNNTSFKMYITIMTMDIATFAYKPIPKSELLYYPRTNYLKTNTSGIYIMSESLPLVDCTDDVFADYNSGYASEKAYLSPDAIEYIKQASLCIPDVDYTISNNIQEQMFFDIDFSNRLYKHLNSRYPNIMVQVSYRTVLLNPENFTNHYYMVWKQGFFPLRPNKLDYYRLDIESYEVKKDQTVFLFPDERKQQLINGKELTLEVSLDTVLTDDQNLVMISMSKNNLSTRTKIKYTSLNDFISQFGGSFGALFPIFQFLLRLITKKIYGVLLLDRVFKLYQPEDAEYRNVFKSSVLGSKQTNISEIASGGKEQIESHVTNNHLILKNNALIHSIDKQVVYSTKLKPELGEEFLNKSVEKTKRVKLVPINMRDYCCAKRYTRSLDLCVIAQKCGEMIEHSSDIANLLVTSILLKRITSMLFNKEELSIISNMNVNIHKCKDKQVRPTNPSTVEGEIKMLMGLDYKERRNRKLLKEFINNNY
jgi:hypothetical protein